MAKITREPQRIFGGTLPPSNNIAVFGSLKLGSPSYSGDPSVIQSAEYDLGWGGAVVANQAPALQDMNALFYVDTYQLAYLMQTGVPEWNAATEYYIGSVVNDGSGSLYMSLTDANLNNVLSDTTKWRQLVPSTPSTAKNYSLATSVGSGAMTITLGDQIGATPSVVSPCMFAFRSSTANVGTLVLRQATSATSVVISSGASLGLPQDTLAYLYVYAIDNAGSVELAVAGSLLDTSSLRSTVAMSGGATNIDVLYSTVSRTNVPVLLLGRIGFNEAAAGNWVTNASEISLNPVLGVDETVLTANGQRAYFHNIAANNGITPSITVAGSGSGSPSVLNGILIPYQLSNGTWRLKFNIYATWTAFSASFTTVVTYSINGVTTAATLQSGSSATTSAGCFGGNCLALSSSSTIQGFLLSNTGANCSDGCISGDIALSSKPTWAY